jgi:tetraether lipid synthase
MIIIPNNPVEGEVPPNRARGELGLFEVRRGIVSTQTIAPAKSKKLAIIQPATTYTGAPITPMPKGLPKTTQSLCPECLTLVEALIYEEDSRVLMEKKCPEHGEFRDIISSDAYLYRKMESCHYGDTRGIQNPAVPDAKSCPDDCGMCSLHLSHTGLANIDLTNRCNLTCPVCFANANVQGYLYEPSYEQVVGMLQALRDERPVAGRIVQFSGGEPTLHPRFFDIIAKAAEMGFSHIQIATNGIEMAKLEFAQRAKDAGLHDLYLQFDGVTDDIYLRTRGARLMDIKLAAVENARKTGMKIILVPTIVKGVNDDQIGDIMQFAIDNVDCTSGISFQPVAFTGRIARRELEAKRFTLADFAHRFSEQTGLTEPHRDWYPLGSVAPFSRLVSALRGDPTVELSCHPHCSLGTYFFVNPESRECVPASKFIEIGPMMDEMERLSRRSGKVFSKLFTGVGALSALHKYYHEEHAPGGLSFQRFLQTLQGFTDKRYGRGKNDGTFSYKTLMVAGMHFMDAYNYDVERVKRCVIHYSAPDGKLYPFCTYNSGPCYREKIEKQFSVPLPEGMRLNSKSNGNGSCSSSCGSC